MKFIKDILTTFSTQIIGVVLGLAAAIIIVRVLGPLGKGCFSYYSERVETCLQALQEACKRGGKNIVPYCIEAIRANATKGEMAKVFRKAFGLWKPPAYW